MEGTRRRGKRGRKKKKESDDNSSTTSTNPPPKPDRTPKSWFLPNFKLGDKELSVVDQTVLTIMGPSPWPIDVLYKVCLEQRFTRITRSMSKKCKNLDEFMTYLRNHDHLFVVSSDFLCVTLKQMLVLEFHVLLVTEDLHCRRINGHRYTHTCNLIK